jgi:hypothetical protein
MGIWWDSDLLREILDGVTITKWNYTNARELPLLNGAEFDCMSNNGTKANPSLCADILGDWREELICRTRDNRELRIFTTTLPAERRLVTWMHDPGITGWAWPAERGLQPACHPPSANRTHVLVAGQADQVIGAATAHHQGGSIRTSALPTTCPASFPHPPRVQAPSRRTRDRDKAGFRAGKPVTGHVGCGLPRPVRRGLASCRTTVIPVCA